MPERLRLMREICAQRFDWVLSGSFDIWGSDIVALCDLVVFVCTPVEARLARLWDREARRHGAGAMVPGTTQHAEATAFIEWASHYEDGTREGRNLARHLAWLTRLPCAVIEVDGAMPIVELTRSVLSRIETPARES